MLALESDSAIRPHPHILLFLHVPVPMEREI